MKHLGTIDLDLPITLKGKPHGVEYLSTLPVWTIADTGRVIYDESSGNYYGANSTGWQNLSQVAHNHDDIYYTESEVNAFFSGTNEGKMLVEWINVLNTPATYAPISHDNSAHSQTYITAADITYTVLNENSLIGTNVNQIASGTHAHDTVYATIGHDHTGVYALDVHNHDALYAAIGHDHSGVYSVVGHDHDGIYAPSSHAHDTLYATIGHDHAGVYALDTHNHDTLYATIGHDHAGVYALDTHNHDSAYAAIGHDHSGVYTPVITEIVGQPSDTPSVGTIRLSDDNNLYVYTSTGWKFVALSSI